VLHHYNTQELIDPDMIERNTAAVRNAPVPRFVKALIILTGGLVWKVAYYGPGAMSVTDPKQREEMKDHNIFVAILRNLFDLRRSTVRRLWLGTYLPYVGFHFVLIPALFLPLGTTAAAFVLANKLMAEVITNFHSFFVVAPNHAGDDIPRYTAHYQSKGDFYITQTCSAANYSCGTEAVDHMQIWLNYQIEHHVFPNIPMLQYRWVQPRYKALCEEYGIPYIQGSIWKRFGKAMAICTKASTHPVTAPGQPAPATP